jgi:hypothetical protein
MESGSHFIYISNFNGMPPSILELIFSRMRSWALTHDQDGGLYCDQNGNIQKPFPDRPYCEEGTSAVAVVNKCGQQISFCQTVLPGSESMLIPTLIEDTANIAVPGPKYWLSTAAQ